MLPPDMKVIIEMQLCRTGFSQYKTLAEKLSVLFSMLQTQVCTTPGILHLCNSVPTKFYVNTYICL